MSSKRKQRELALQILFVWDANGDANHELATRVTDDVTIEPDGREHALSMARGAWDGRETSDQWVERLAPQWPPRRQPGVDRNLIRLGIWEMTHADTPPKVVIDEAIELARHFSTEQSPNFVNGILDAVFKEIVALKEESGVRRQEAGEEKTEGQKMEDLEKEDRNPEAEDSPASLPQIIFAENSAANDSLPTT